MAAERLGPDDASGSVHQDSKDKLPVEKTIGALWINRFYLAYQVVQSDLALDGYGWAERRG